MTTPCALTIATVVFNARHELERTLASVAAQKCAGVNYVVVDGGSRDGTVDVARSRPDIVDELISERDRGIYDAMNKAIVVARGQAIVFLNAGDTLTPGAMPELLRAAHTADRIVCHPVNFCRAGRVLSVYHPQRPPERHDPQHMYWPHPGLVAKLSVFRSIGRFDESLRYAADLDWVNRLLRDRTLTVSYSDQPVVDFELGGASSTSGGARETRDVAIRHGKALPMAYARYFKVRARLWGGHLICRLFNEDRLSCPPR